MTTLFADDLNYLPGLKHPPLSSAPGFEAFPGSTLREFVTHELHSDEGTPAYRAWVARAAARLGIA